MKMSFRPLACQPALARRLSAAAAAVTALLFLFAASAFAQQGRGQNFPGVPNYPGTAQMPEPMSSISGNPITRKMEIKRMDALNAERQKALVADTNKLLELTAALNAQINGKQPAALSAAQLHMVAEIEKLAHNVREKMSSTVNGGPQLGPAAPPLMLPPNMP